MCVSAATLVVSSAVLSSARAGHRVPPGTYAGTIAAPGSPAISVLIGRDETGEKPTATVDPAAIPVLCAGHETEEREFPAIEAPKRGPGRYEQRSYSYAPSGARQLFKVEVREKEDGRLRGFVFYFDTRCSSDGLLRWNAVSSSDAE